MRFEEVRAPAFGPLQDASLPLAPGMNVVFGPNEAGKSSWHAALWAGLCGRRRGQGSRGADELHFRERYRPWDGARWEAGALVELEDGRRVEIQQELEGNVKCRAMDAVLGRDVSNEIMSDGSPDGARFLGLDRRSFLATACVRQADLLGVLSDARSLQQHLERAAATAGTDDTAAGALARLEAFQKQHVGKDQANAVKPLRAAVERVRAKERAAAEAQARHEAYLDLAEEVERLREAAEMACDRAAAHRAAAARQEATRWTARAGRAAALLARHPEGRPSGDSAGEELAQEAAAAVRAWRDQPVLVSLEGDSADTLQAELDALPAPPDGDTEPGRAVTMAAEDYRGATRALQEHERARPSPVEAPSVGGASEQELRDLARALSASAPVGDPAAAERLRQAQSRADTGTASGSAPWMPIAGGAVAIVGVVLMLLGAIAGAALVVGGVAAIVWALMGAARAAQERARALEDLNSATASAGAATAAAEQARAAAARTQELGVPPDPAELLRLADAVAAATLAERDANRWADQERRLREAVDGAAASLRHALVAHGAERVEDVLAAVEAYGADCRERARVAQAAARRPDLERRLKERREHEETAAQIAQRHGAASEQVRRVAEACDVSSASEEELVERLEDWRQRWLAVAKERKQAVADWGELDSLLEGRTIDELKAETEKLRRQADRLEAAVSPALLAATTLGSDPGREQEQLDKQERAAAHELDEEQGRLREGLKDIPSVSEAEEALAAAKDELERVRDLDRILGITQELLAVAQDRVHRDIAPVLATSVKASLPWITGGRYVDARVDPQSLDVKVQTAAGDWRPAAMLSHGSAEQVYLLLRLALAQHLTAKGEICPVVLDEVTVQADHQRTLAILETLHEISEKRQVIVFTQEDEVLTWAEQHLQEPRDRLTQLDAPI